MQTITAREFNQNPSKILRMVEHGPVQVTVRGDVSFIAAKPDDIEIQVPAAEAKSTLEKSRQWYQNLDHEERAAFDSVPDDWAEFTEASGPEFEFDLD